MAHNYRVEISGTKEGVGPILIRYISFTVSEYVLVI